jgi:ATP-dependent DNA ligase
MVILTDHFYGIIGLSKFKGNKMSVYKIVEQLRATRSKNEKEEILKSYTHNEDLRNFFRLALNPFILFYQKKDFIQTSTGENSLTEAMAWLENVIASRQVTGNAAQTFIQNCIDKLSEDDAKVIMMILKKKPDCGVTTTANKVWAGTAPEFPCMLATAYEEKLAEKMNWKAGVLSQLKSDGGRVAIIIDESGGVSVFSRAGNELDVFGKFDVLGKYFNSVVFDGELLAHNSETGKFHPRQYSNGLFTKCVRGTLSETEAELLHAVVWDAIPLAEFKAEKSKNGTGYRFAVLQQYMRVLYDYPNAGCISLIPSKVIRSIEEAQAHYQEMLAAGEEGTMLKDQDSLWESKRSKKILKLKSEFTGDLIVTGFIEGTGKLAGNLGSLEMTTSCGKCVASMSGFTLKLRSEIYANLQERPVSYTMIEDNKEVLYTANPGDTEINIGEIVELLYNQKIKSRNSEIWSLFLPRFSQVRKDKKVANSLGELA